MTESAVAVVSLLVLGWAIVSGPLARHNITGPLLFMIAGYLLGNPDWGPLSVDVEAPAIHVVAELALALVLFSDASRVNIPDLRRDLSLPVRLLAIGLPLSVIFGGLLAAGLLDELPWALAGGLGLGEESSSQRSGDRPRWAIFSTSLAGLRRRRVGRRGTLRPCPWP